MNAKPSARESRLDIELRLRERGAVLDMPFTQSIYKPLLENQPRDGVEAQLDLRYGEDPRQRLDVYRSSTAKAAPKSATAAKGTTSGQRCMGCPTLSGRYAPGKAASPRRLCATQHVGRS